MPPLVPLAPSEPKFRFVARLGLDQHGQQHIYAILKAEAEQAWERLQSGRDALLLHLKDRPTVQPPFAYGQMSETASQREILNVYENASPQTRPIYDLAYEPGIVNWIIKWLVWHTFRDRDQRKKPRTQSGELTIQSGEASIIDQSTTLMPLTPVAHGNLATQVLQSGSEERDVLIDQLDTTYLAEYPDVSAREADEASSREAQASALFHQEHQEREDLGPVTVSEPRAKMRYDPVRDL